MGMAISGIGRIFRDGWGRHVGVVLLALSLTDLCGLNAPVIQVVGWTSMITSRIESVGVARAVTEAFGGGKPCRLCHQAMREAGGKDSDRVPAPTADDKQPKSVAAASADGRSVWRPLIGVHPERVARPDRLTPAPGVPPPRAIQASA